MNKSPILFDDIITIYNPLKLVFGNGCLENMIDDVASMEDPRVFIVLSNSVKPSIDLVLEGFKEKRISFRIWTNIDKEPTISMVEDTLQAAKDFNADTVLGIGGGSVLDTAKLVAALLQNEQNIRDVIGIGKLKKRNLHLVCVPTTSGTGSEVSPNSILLDEAENLKKGVISPFLVPDASYIDPLLTKTVPPSITASTGLDALTHCIEAYANRFSHPMVDLYALEGINLIGANLEQAIKNGNDIEARTNVALGSMYGGLCLGPVNTAAVHALSYPLGSRYQIAHGISNAVLLPYVMEFNLSAAPERYARIAEALGVEGSGLGLGKAKQGIAKIRDLINKSGSPSDLSSFNIPESDIKKMAEMAMTIDRLLNNNIREVTIEDVIAIYKAAY